MGSGEWTVKALVERMWTSKQLEDRHGANPRSGAGDADAERLRDVLPADLADHLSRHRDRPDSLKRRLGKAFQYRQGQFYGHRSVRRGEDDSTNVARWTVTHSGH